MSRTASWVVQAPRWQRSHAWVRPRCPHHPQWRLRPGQQCRAQGTASLHAHPSHQHHYPNGNLPFRQRPLGTTTCGRNRQGGHTTGAGPPPGGPAPGKRWRGSLPHPVSAAEAGTSGYHQVQVRTGTTPTTTHPGASRHTLILRQRYPVKYQRRGPLSWWSAPAPLPLQAASSCRTATP